MRTVKSTAILLSRQHLRPSLKDEWVRGLKMAVKYVKSKGWILFSSVGSPNWEIITAAAVIEDVPLKLFLPVIEPEEFEKEKLTTTKNFNLKSQFVEFEAVLPNKVNSNNEELWQYRDRIVIESSDIIIPVSVRPKGLMSELLQKAKENNKNVVHDFQVEYVMSKNKLAYSIDKQQLSDSIRQVSLKYLIHWTRSSNGPWPNEKKIDFYESVLNATAYPRTAIKTLERIIIEKIIIASSKKMPGKTPTVSFTGLAPVEIIKLMKWRARYRQMSFEPYGIGIEKKEALSIGISEVQYYNSKPHKKTLNTPDWLSQSMGKITDWRNEEEFRYKGDLILTNVPVGKLIAVCFNKNEAIELENKTGIKTVWFCD